MRLDGNADLAHLVDHFGPQIIERVRRRDREVAGLVGRLVAEVRPLGATCVPSRFHRVDFVHGPVLLRHKSDVVEDEELGLGADVAGVGDAGLLQIGDPLLGDVPRIAGVLFFRDRIDDVGDHAHGGHLEKRVQDGRLRVRNRQHVGGIDGLPAADRRAVESEPVLEDAIVQRVDRIGAVLPGSEHVAELQVDLLGIVLLHEFEEFLGGHSAFPFVNLIVHRRAWRIGTPAQRVCTPRGRVVAPHAQNPAISRPGDEGRPSAAYFRKGRAEATHAAYPRTVQRSTMDGPIRSEYSCPKPALRGRFWKRHRHRKNRVGRLPAKNLSVFARCR